MRQTKNPSRSDLFRGTMTVSLRGASVSVRDSAVEEIGDYSSPVDRIPWGARCGREQAIHRGGRVRGLDGSPSLAVCPRCSQRLTRRHRTRVEKLFFTDVFYCGRCRDDVRFARVDVSSSFILSRYTRCASCSAENVKRVRRGRWIASLSPHPLSLLFRLTGAPPYVCRRCWCQYYDWRPLAPTPVRSAEPHPVALRERAAQRS